MGPPATEPDYLMGVRIVSQLMLKMEKDPASRNVGDIDELWIVDAKNMLADMYAYLRLTDKRNKASMAGRRERHSED